MITYRKDKSRHILSMSHADLSNLAEVIFLLKHTPPPVGFNRKPFTTSQQRIIDNLCDVIEFPPEYASMLNAKTGQ